MKKLYLIFLAATLLFTPVQVFAENNDDDDTKKSLIMYEEIEYKSTAVKPIGKTTEETKVDTIVFPELIDEIDNTATQIINDKDEFERKELEEKAKQIMANAQQSTIVVRDGYNLSDDDIKLIASVVYGEAGNQSYEGKLAVANIILNRLENGYWGSSVESVVYSPCQFCAVEGSMFSDAMANGPNADCMQAAEDAVSGLNNVGNYLYFRTTEIAEYDSYSTYMIIGDHVFY
jgi:spore germination cell wall hydrolase CwlJ-like protein